MTYVIGSVAKLIEHWGYPGWLEVIIPTIRGNAVVVDKIPIFDADVDENTPLPCPILVKCSVRDRIHDDHGREMAVIELCYHVEDANGNGTFTVFADQIVEQ